MAAKPIRTHQLTARQDRAVELIVAGNTLVDVAKQLRINRCTLTSWNKQPTFAREVEKRRAETIRASARKLHALADVVIEALTKELEHGRNGGDIALRILQMVGFGDAIRDYLKPLAPVPLKTFDDCAANPARLDAIDRELKLLRAERDRINSASSGSRQ